jgi:hypothetical protein
MKREILKPQGISKKLHSCSLYKTEHNSSEADDGIFFTLGIIMKNFMYVPSLHVTRLYLLNARSSIHGYSFEFPTSPYIQLRKNIYSQCMRTKY